MIFLGGKLYFKVSNIANEIWGLLNRKAWKDYTQLPKFELKTLQCWEVT